MNNRNFFNSMAEKWDETVSHDEGKIRMILDLVRVNEGDRILDVGTGTGIMIPFLHSNIGSTGTITAVDMAEKMIEVARNKFNFDNVRFIAGDVLKIELSENYFHCIMCYSMFPHFEDKRAAIEKLARYLKKDGKFVVCHSQSRETINNLHKQVSEIVKDDRLPSVDKIKEYYNNAGLETISAIDNEDMFVIIGRKI